MNETMLKAEKLSKTFKSGKGRVRALKEVDLQVGKGEFISIMGPSGSGKTTLLTLLGCLDTPSGGKLILDGQDVTAMDESELCMLRRRKLGFVFQTFNLLPYLSALENVELPMESVEPSPEKRRQKALELLESVGLKKRVDHRPNKLSAGEQQRVAIARALANDPAVIIADEPTGNLDSRTKYNIIRLLGRMNAEKGTTIVMVTHDTSIGNHADRMLWISDGHILKKERRGMNLIRKGMMCHQCREPLNPGDEKCAHCGTKVPPRPQPGD
jgi:putative ABC transport system ATP-binding protein